MNWYITEHKVIVDKIIFAIVMITVVGIVLWDIYNEDEENEPRE
jgi:cytochrome b subunit of formate dehydrogenase